MEGDRNAPYAPASAVISLIRRHRNGRLPDPLVVQELPRLGVSEGNAPRTLQAMRLLGLLDDEGRHQPTFARLGRSTTVEYPTVLGEILKEAYAPVFQIIDPATASEVEITDAFRSYQPQGQRDRMIKLFVGLCREAGLMPGGPPETISRAKKVPAAQPKPAAALPPRRPAGRGVPAATPLPTRAYEQVEALVRHLPPERRWTPARRNRWLQAVTATVDLLIELEGPERQLPLQLPGATDDGRTVESSVGQTS